MRWLLGLFEGSVARLNLINFNYIGTIPAQGGFEFSGIPTALRPSDLPNTCFVAYGGSTGVVVRMTISPFERSNPLYLENETRIRTAFMDHDGRYGYFATRNTPSRVVKIDLEKMERVGSLLVRSITSGGILCSAISSDDAIGYLGGEASPGTPSGYFFYRINLDSFHHFGTFASVLGAGLHSMAIDEAGSKAWVATRTTSSGSHMEVHAVDLDPYQFGVQTGSLQSQFQGNLEAAIYDRVSGRPIFASTSSPAIMFRFTSNLSSSILNAFPPGFNHCNTLIHNPSNGLIYAGLGQTTGQIVSIDPNVFFFVKQHPGVSDNGGIYSGAFVPSGEHGLFTTNGRVLKVTEDLSRIDGNLALPIGENTPARGLLLSPDGDRAWYGSGGEEAVVGRINLFPRDQINAIRIQLGQTADVDSFNFYSFAKVGPRRTKGARFARDLFYPTSVAFDPSSGHALFGTANFPGHIIKFDTANMTAVANATLKEGSDELWSAFMEPDGEHACFGTLTSPGRVIRVRTSDLEPIQTLEGEPGEDNFRAAAVDPNGEYGYFASSNSPGRIVKVHLADLDRVDGLILEEDDGQPRCLLIDPSGEFAYVGCATFPGRVVKIRLSDFTRIGALPLEPGEDIAHAGVIDSAGEFAYFGMDTFPTQIVKVRLSDFTRVGVLTLEGESYTYGVAIAPDDQRLVIGLDFGRVATIDLATFTLEGTCQLRYLESPLTSAMIVDASGENAYLCAATEPGRVVRVELTPKPLRLGIYGNVGEGKELLWQSQPIPIPNSEEWVSAPISEGNPPNLILPPDEYWLAWQVDASTRAASYSFGNAGDGLTLDWPHGPFPETLTQGTDTVWTVNNNRWGLYISYNGGPTGTPTHTFTETSTQVMTPTPVMTSTPDVTPTPIVTPMLTTPPVTPTPSATATPIGPTATPSPTEFDFDIGTDPKDDFIDARDLIALLNALKEEGVDPEVLIQLLEYWQKQYPGNGNLEEFLELGE